MDDCTILCGIFIWGALLWTFLVGPPLLFVYVTVLAGVRFVRARLARSLWSKIVSFLLLALFLLTLVFVPFPFNMLHLASALAGLLVGMLIRVFAPSFGEPRDRS